MFTRQQSRTLRKGYLAVLDRERERRTAEYAETSVLTIQFHVSGNHAYYENLIRQLAKPYAGIHAMNVISDDFTPVLAPSRRHLSVDEAARKTGYSVHQITRWLRAGHWSGSKVDGHWQIEPDSSFSRPPRRMRHH